MLLRRAVALRRGLPPRAAASRPFSFSFPGAGRKLDEVVKLDLLKDEPPERVKEIWLEFHASKHNAFGSVLPPPAFSLLLSNAAACPFFIVPVLKPDGAFFNLLAQWQDTVCLLTFLEDYQADPAAAQPYLTLSTYDELLESKELGLLRGDVGPALKAAEAAQVAGTLLSSYIQPEEYERVTRFNHSPESFDFQEYLDAVIDANPSSDR